MNLPPRLKPRKNPSQERSRALVDATLEAGRRVLIAKGYEGLTMSAVARLAGVSVGSLYQYFPNKESLIAALIEARSEAEAAFIAERFAHVQRPRAIEQVMEQAISAVFAFRAGAPELHSALLECIAHIGRHPLLVARGERVLAQLRTLIAPHYTSGHPVPLDHVLFVLANAIHSVTHEGLIPRPADLSDAGLAREVARLVSGYLREQ